LVEFITHLSATRRKFKNRRFRFQGYRAKPRLFLAGPKHFASLAIDEMNPAAGEACHGFVIVIRRGFEPVLHVLIGYGAGEN
jgi:hypothetical protein